MPRRKTLLDESSIHGLRFIVDSSQNKYFRIFWAVAFACSIAGMSYYAKGVVVKFFERPDVGHEIHSRPIRDVPFPAVTICSPVMAKVDYTNYGRFKAFYKLNMSLEQEFSSDQQKRLSALVQACDFKDSVEGKLEEDPDAIVKYLEEGKSRGFA